ncbi:helix-turn-helix domain-containing protein [Xenorhabdus cabanillasii]|nr:helix-turn-helix domain-containing protein [Xenorhabdus cabanillasii]
MRNVLYRPWPKGERIIANCLNVHPSEIWPSRYSSKKNRSRRDKVKG